jgi:hypothetical protein
VIVEALDRGVGFTARGKRGAQRFLGRGLAGAAGNRDDARAQFEWVIRNSRDPAQLEVARRELQRP